VRAQEAEAAPPAAAPKAAGRPKREQAAGRPAQPKLAPIELLEVEVARAETRVAELEQQLAADWSDTALLAAHREAREDLAALLARWETMFDEASGR
jgi:hypothetical protein